MEHAFPCGTLSLDFLGTRRARRNLAPTEKLDDAAALDAWFVESGMLDAAPEADESALHEAVELREAIYGLMTARMSGGELPEASVALVNRHAAAAPIAPQLRGARVQHRGDVAQGLAALAREAVEIVGGPDGALLRECARPECTQLYLDTSRGHRREWCAMSTCGNRMKASAFRARQREELSA